MAYKRKLAIMIFPLVKVFVSKPKVLSIMDTLAEIKKGKSMARFGDGELQAITKNIDKNSFQDNSDELSFEMKRAINLCNPQLINAIGTPFSWNFKILNNKSKEYWKPLLIKNWKKWGKVLNKNEYYDAFISRPYFDLSIQSRKKISKSIFDGFKFILKDKKILIIEGKYSRFGVNDDLLDGCKEIYRLIGPEKNAFKKKQEIEACTREIVKQKNIDIILISLGQTATIMVGDLLDLNIQVLDIGHLDIEYNWYLEKAEEKKNIPGKWVNEATPTFVEFTNKGILKKYKKQIVRIIK